MLRDALAVRLRSHGECRERVQRHRRPDGAASWLPAVSMTRWRRACTVSATFGRDGDTRVENQSHAGLLRDRFLSESRYPDLTKVLVEARKSLRPKSTGLYHWGIVIMTTAYDFDATALDGTPRPLREFSGSVLLIVNTASKCGSRPNIRVSKHCSGSITTGDSKCSAFRATSSVRRSPAPNARLARLPAELWRELSDVPEAGCQRKRRAPSVSMAAGTCARHPGHETNQMELHQVLVDRTGKVAGRFSPRTRPDDLEKHVEKLL